MQWEDEAILLSARRHGEGALVLQVFAAEHGRHGGLVRGGASRKSRSTYQVGNLLAGGRGWRISWGPSRLN